MTERSGPSSGHGSETDILVRWAAEEFVAAGRVLPEVTQSEHRRRAHFFTEVFRELRAGSAERIARPESQSDLGRMLARAFGGPVHGQSLAAADRPCDDAGDRARRSGGAPA